MKRKLSVRACTEIALVLKQKDLPVPLIDPLQVLAEVVARKGNMGKMNSKFTRKIRLLRDYYKAKGLTELCRFIIAWSIHYNKYYIHERDLSKPINMVQARIPVKIRLLSRSEDDINRLTEFWPDDYAPLINTPQNIREIIVSRLSAGEECIITEYEGKIVLMNWIGFQNTHLFNRYGQKWRIGANEALCYNVYCTVEYRGNNVQAASYSEIFNLLRRKGYKNLIVYVGSLNYANMKVTTKMLGEPVQTLRSLSILGFNFHFLSRRLV